MATHTFCDGVQRRDFLKVGAVSGFGLGMGLPQFLAKAKEGDLNPKAKGKAPQAAKKPAGLAGLAGANRFGGLDSDDDDEDDRPEIGPSPSFTPRNHTPAIAQKCGKLANTSFL